jgi:DNA-binding transcriptional regulator YbjK
MQSPRAELIAETAITLLAERGMRGLTHRAVDEAAGLPAGSTSNLARTRAALLELTLTRLSELEDQHFAMAGVPAPSTTEITDVAAAVHAGQVALMIAGVLHEQIYSDRRRMIARYELALEATRRPELRVIYDRAGRPFHEAATALMELAGSSAPARHGNELVAFCEGVMFDAIVGAGDEPSLSDLQAAAADMLRGLLGE